MDIQTFTVQSSTVKAILKEYLTNALSIRNLSASKNPGILVTDSLKPEFTHTIWFSFIVFYGHLTNISNVSEYSNRLEQEILQVAGKIGGTQDDLVGFYFKRGMSIHLDERFIGVVDIARRGLTYAEWEIVSIEFKLPLEPKISSEELGKAFLRSLGIEAH